MSYDIHNEIAEQYPLGPECSKAARDYWYTQGFNHALLIVARRQQRINELETIVEALSTRAEAVPTPGEHRETDHASQDRTQPQDKPTPKAVSERTTTEPKEPA